MGVIDEILERIDPVEVIGEYVKLEKSGKEYRGLCPFHHEKTPSFYVNPQTGLYHCFGCGASGNIFRFIMDIEGVDFKEALRILAKRAGVELGEIKEQKEVSVLTRFADYLHHILTETSNPALQYVKNKRKLKVQDIAKFKLGYYPDGALRNFIKRENLQSSFMVRLGLLKEGKSGFYEVFRGRLIFPILSETGKVIGLGGRVLDSSSGPKYINSPDSVWFKKGKHLYGYYQSKKTIREKREVIITEGYMDVIAMHASGYDYTVASLGTSFTEEHAIFLSKHVDRAYLLFDMDEAGRKAVDRVIPMLFKNNVIPFIVRLEGAKDPADLYEQGKTDSIDSAVNEATDFVEYYLKDVRSDEERIRALHLVKSIIELSKDDVLRGVYLKKVKDLMGIELKLQSLNAPAVKKKREVLSPELKMLLAAMQFEDLKEFIKDSVEVEVFRDEDAREIVSELKKGKDFEEVVATVSEDRAKRYVEFLTTLDFGEKSKNILREDLERKLNIFMKERKLKKLSLDEVIKLKKEEMEKHERLDNPE